ncbi:MAG: tetratricopeptide repeat protein [Chloroflexi bacterium]|nr:tetratricopeptide repeat protein [Chloroflexota bacterium]
MLHIHLFGYLRLFENDQPLKFAALPKTLPLFAYLLLNKANPIARATIASQLWPGLPEKEARANLRRHLYELRRALPMLPAKNSWVLGTMNMLQWNPDAEYWLDVAEFERLSLSSDHLGKAVALYQDDLLPELYDDWIAPQRERLRNLFVANLKRLVEMTHGRRDYQQAITYAQQLLAHDPLHEDITNTLMRVKYGMGDRAGAIQTFQTFAQCLQAELELSPMPETMMLYANIVQNNSLSGTIREKQSVGKTADPHRHNIPAQFTPFFGRSQDLIAIIDMLESPDVRLLTLTGVGGSGKTRLALEVADRLLSHQSRTFPDGIYFVDLTAVNEPERLLSVIAECLEVKESGNQPLLETLITFLRPKYMLLLLDNFEQIIAAAPLLSKLLAAVPGLRILATSRTLLQLYGEYELPVSPLPLPDPNQLPAATEMLEFAAVALFVARVRAFKPSFNLTEANRATIAQICTRLDGLPLAIELAAARIRLFTPAALLVQLDKGIHILSSRRRDLPLRHRTLSATIAWSYNLLGSTEQRLFTRLALFYGGFTAMAAAACVYDEPLDDPQLALERLTSLVEQNLIIVVAADTNIAQPPRFDMLTIIHEYAQNLLLADPMQWTLQYRHAAYYASLVEKRHTDTANIAPLRTEETNLRAAFAWANRQQLSAESGMTLNPPLIKADVYFSLARGLGDVLMFHGHYQEATAVLSHWLVTAQTIGDIKEQAEALQRRAHIYAQLGKTRQSLDTAEQAAVLARRAGNTAIPILGDALSLAGWGLARLGNYAAARVRAESALKVAMQTSSALFRIDSLNLLAYLSDLAGDYTSTAVYYEQALAAARSANHLIWETTLLNNLAESLKFIGRTAESIPLLEQSLLLARQRSAQSIEALALCNLGEAQLDLGDAKAAAANLRRSIALTPADGAFYLAFSQAKLAHACALLGQIDEAINLAQAALNQALATESHDDIVAAWLALAQVTAVAGPMIIQGKTTTTNQCYAQSVRVCTEAGMDVERAHALWAWGHYHQQQKDAAQAETLWQEARSIFARLDLRHWLARMAERLS